MGSQPSATINQIQAVALQRERKRRKLTQAELAAMVGLSEDYVGAMERGKRSHQSLDVVFKLANALGVPYDVFATSTFTRRELSQAVGGAAATPLVYLPNSDAGTPERVLTSEAVLPKVADVLSECDRLRTQGQWEEACEMGLAARAHFAEGSVEWSTITTEVCALMCQQVGDVAGATRYLAEVEDKVTADGQEGPPEILGSVYFRQAWIYLEQLGNLNKALSLNARARRLFEECGYATLERWSRHFEVRIHSEGCRVSNMFLPRQASRLRNEERQMFVKDYQESQRLLDENIEGAYLIYRGFLSASLIKEHDALNQTIRLSSVFKDNEARYFLHMVRAEASLRDGDFDEVIIHARNAREGYMRVRSMLGIAMSSALEAYAIGQSVSLSQEDKKRCLDLWSLAILVHPYQGHYLYQQCAIVFKQAWRRMISSEKASMSYLLHLDEEIQRGEGVFRGTLALPRRLYGVDFIRSLLEGNHRSH